MNWRGAVLFVSALALAFVTNWPDTREQFPLWVIFSAGHLADTMFHEIGHALFALVMGYPAIPSIFTLFGRDQAAGVSLTFDHSWFVQIAVWAAMGYGIHWLWRKEMHLWAGIAAAVTLSLFALSFWHHNPVVWAYMGHGSAILMGGFFLYRGLLDLDARHAFERWLNLFFGCFMLVRNGLFAWSLAFNDMERAHYSGLKIFGAQSHDFMNMTEEWYRLSVQGIAQATVVYVLLVVVVTFVLARIRRNDYSHG